MGHKSNISKLQANQAYFQRRAKRFQYIWQETKLAYNTLVNQYNIVLCQLSQCFDLGKAVGIHETATFIDNFEEINSRRREKIIELSKDKQKLIDEIQYLKSNTNAPIENSRPFEVNDNSFTENSKLVAENEKLVVHNHELTEGLHKCTDDNKKLGEEIRILTSDNNKYLDENKKLTDEKIELSNFGQKLKRENQQLQEKYEGLDKMNTTLHSILHNKNEEITELNGKLDILLEEHKEIFAEMGIEYENPFLPVVTPAPKKPNPKSKKKK
jgi:uncharacterized phage infection (PIP) family protein YhgE